MNKLDRIIYLDGDIIVQEDLEELYNCNIGDNYIGAVKDTNGIDYDFFGKKIYKYFNSGVMIMNLEKMRRDKISKKLLEYRKCGYNKLMDQDTFNFVVKDAVTLLPFKFNTQMNTLSGKLIKNHNYNIKNFKKYWNITEKYYSYKQYKVYLNLYEELYMDYLKNNSDINLLKYENIKMQMKKIRKEILKGD